MWLWDHPHWIWFWDHPPLNVILRPSPTECDFETIPHWIWFWDHPHWMWFWGTTTECDFKGPPLNVILRPPPTECDFETTPHWMWFWDHPHWMWFWGTPTECDFETTPHWRWFWDHPPLKVIFRDTQQNQCKGPRIPRVSTESNHSFRPISLSPCVYPRHLFPYCDPTEEFSPHRGGWFSIGSSQTITLLQALDDACDVRCQACICQTRIIFPRSLANEIHYDVDENLWPNPQDRADTNIEEQWGLFLIKVVLSCCEYII